MTSKGRIFGSRWLAMSIIAVLAVIGVAGCDSADTGVESATVRYQSEQGLLDLIQMGKALNVFPNITFEKRGDVTNGPASLQALVGHQIDISQQAFFGAVAQLAAGGAPIKAVISTYGANPQVHSQLVTLAGSPITSAKDLIGKKIAVNTLGANDEAVIDTYLRKSGLSADQIKSITLVPLPPLNSAEALQNHQIDAAYMKLGHFRHAQHTMDLAVLTTDVDVVGDYNAGGYAMTDEFLRRNPNTSRELVTGIAKTIDYVETHPAEHVLKIYTDWLNDNGFAAYVEPIEKNYPGGLGVARHDGSIDEGDVARWIPWLEERGDIDTSKIVPSEIFTNDYNLLVAGAGSGAAPSEQAKP